MKKLNKYLMLFVAAFALVGCVDDVTETPSMEAQTGDEVQFGLTLPSSRLVYDQENPVKENGIITAFPLYWTNKDKVFIFSPDCLDGRRGAEYEVGVDNDNAQNYATSLTKTGAFGVQWGEDETATFYSLFPSGKYGLSDDGSLAKGIWVNYTQTIDVNGGNIKSDMEDCLLYARTENVAKGTTVNLNYKPITTTFMVKLQVADNSTKPFTITSISIVADGTDIAGKFDINVNNGSFADFADNSSNTVTANIVNKATGGYHTLAANEAVEFPMFLAPVDGLNTDGWKIIVNTLVEGVTKTFTKTLTAQDITPGQVHMISLPKLSVKAEEIKEWDPATWMVNIPRNVYLSEVSIPGSWNSINNDFQKMGDSDKLTIDNQYKIGVRAFHLDTRWKASYSWTVFQKVIGLGVADGGSNGNSVSSVITSGDKYMRGDDTPLVEDIIDQLVGYIKTTPQEYMVLVCTFAQESIQHNGANGWINAISEICNNDAYKDYILPASAVTPDTLVGDAIGKIVVLIGASEEITSTTSPSSTLAENSDCFFSYLPMELKSKMFVATETQPIDNEDQLWYTTTTTNDTGITLYNSHAQLTSSTGNAITNHNRGYVPSVTERDAVLNKILGYSLANTKAGDNRQHNKWLYLGLGGGYVSDGGNTGITSGSYKTIATKYNTWIDGKVKEMGTTPAGATEVVPYYPVGIVMMNHVESHASTVKDILLMNQKYRMQYDASKPTDYTPGQNVPIE